MLRLAQRHLAWESSLSSEWMEGAWLVPSESPSCCSSSPFWPQVEAAAETAGAAWGHKEVWTSDSEMKELKLETSG